jgi:hypothetical protein
VFTKLAVVPFGTSPTNVALLTEFCDCYILHWILLQGMQSDHGSLVVYYLPSYNPSASGILWVLMSSVLVNNNIFLPQNMFSNLSPMDQKLFYSFLDCLF